MAEPGPLDEARKGLAAIDVQILELVKQRVDLAHNIARAKADAGLPTVDFQQEAAVLARTAQEAKRLDLDPDAAQRLIHLLIQSAVSAQEAQRIRNDASGEGKQAVVIGGAGRLGQWMVRFLRAQGHDVHIHDPPVGHDAMAHIQGADLVVMAATPKATADYYAAWQQPPTGLILDVASIKTPIIAGIRALQERGAHVASIHPMFGPDVQLLRDLDVVLVDTGDGDAMSAARALFSNTTARMVDVPLEQHDAWMADVLGLAHATSLAFAHALPEHPLPVRSQTLGALRDVAGAVVQESPDVYYEIQTHNPHAHTALQRLSESIRTLDDIVARQDREAFAAFMQDGAMRLSATESP